MSITVSDFPHDQMLPGVFALALHKGIDLQLDLRAEIHPATPQRIAHVRKARRTRIGPAIEENDVLASPLDQRIDRCVLKMPAVREITIFSQIIGLRKNLAQRVIRPE